MTDDPRRVSRRSLLRAGLAAGGGALAGAAAVGVPVLLDPSGGREPAPDPAAPVDPHGVRQAGIDRPAVPQPHALVLVFAEVTPIGAWLAGLGESITALCRDGEGLPGGAGDLTVTVGVGPRLLSDVDPSLPGAAGLPAFRGDDALGADARAGDLALQIAATDPLAVDLAAERLAGGIPGRRAVRQRVFRPTGGDGAARSYLGFEDGIAVPRGEAELVAHVDIADGPLARGSHWVIRRFRLDVAGFRGLPLADREAAVGRREADGAPLGGGGPRDDVRLEDRAPDGSYVIPLDAHVRRAHPSFTGSALMLRRSYSYDDGDDDRGLLFMSFQRDLRTFVETQRRLDESDRMLEFATPTATFSFVALPGFDDDRPLGATLGR